MKFLRKKTHKLLYKYHFSKYQYYRKMKGWVYRDYLDNITNLHNDEKYDYHFKKMEYHLGMYNDLT